MINYYKPAERVKAVVYDGTNVEEVKQLIKFHAQVNGEHLVILSDPIMVVNQGNVVAIDEQGKISVWNKHMFFKTFKEVK